MIHTLRAATTLDEMTYARAISTLREIASRTRSTQGHELDQSGRGREWANLHGEFGPFQITLKRSSFVAEVHIASLTDLLRDGDPALLSPRECAKATDEVDSRLWAFRFPPFRGWQLRRVDFGHDFQVDPSHVGTYLDFFYQRPIRTDSGPPPRRAREGETTLYWRWSRELRAFTLYDKHKQYADTHPKVDAGAIVRPGSLRFEVREHWKGVKELDLRAGYLLVADVLKPEVAHGVLSEYLDMLGAGSEIAIDDAVGTIISSYPTAHAAMLCWLKARGEAHAFTQPSAEVDERDHRVLRLWPSDK